jgi:peptidoglycan/xylan/chitin deacetylase (PgdA/CDA1 family)
MKKLISLALMLCSFLSTTLAQSPTQNKTGGICFRVDDHQSAQKWRDWNNLFNARGLKFSLAINASRLFTDTAAVNALREIAAAGHELMDHTPDHHMAFFTVRQLADTQAYVGHPALNHINGNKVCLTVVAPNLNSFIGEGSVNLIGNRLISVNNGEFAGINGNPFYALVYLPSRNQYAVYTSVQNRNASNPDTLFLQTYWQETWRNDTAYNIPYHRITTTDVKSNAQSNLLLAQRSKDLFAFYNLPVPKTWIQPGGSYALLNRFEVAEFANVVGYRTGAVNIQSAQKCYNEVDTFSNRRYSLQGPDFYEESNNFTGLTNIIADRSARHYQSFGLSHMHNVQGGWTTFLARVDSLLAWANLHQIPVRTYAQWGSILFDSSTNKAANILPSLNRDINNNGIPDGFNTGALLVQTDGIAASGFKCFASANNNANLASISNLGGLEKGDNLVTMHTKGMLGDSIRLVITYPEMALPTQMIMFAANTNDWTLQSRIVNIPANISRINISWIVIKRTNPGTVKMCAMEMRQPSFPKLFKGYKQQKKSTETFAPIQLESIASDGYFADSTLSFGLNQGNLFSVNYNAETRVLQLSSYPAFLVGKDSIKIWVSNPDGMSDTAWLNFESSSLPEDSSEFEEDPADTLVVVEPIIPTSNFSQKTGGVCFRIDDYQSADRLRALHQVFAKHNKQFTLGINAGRLIGDSAAVNALREIAAAGHELADHTADHQMNFFNVTRVQDNFALMGHPGVSHFSGKKVCLKIDSVITTNFTGEGLVRTNGNLLISNTNGEWRTLGAPVFYSNIYLPHINRVYAYTNLLNRNANDPDTMTLISYWGETVNLGIVNNLAHERLTQYDIKQNLAGILLLTERTIQLLDSFSLPHPKTFLQPSGNYAMLNRAEVKEIFGGNFNYTAGGVFVSPSLKCYNEVDSNNDKRFGIHGPDFREENTTAASITGILADNSAKHYTSFGLSMMSNMTGGLSGYIARIDTLLTWCNSNNIPVLTLNKWANILYDSIPNPFINVMPPLQKDLNKNGLPDGYSGPFSSFDTLDGVVISNMRSYARNNNGTMTAITNLGGLEKGNNTFYMSTKGFTGDSVRVTFTFPEINSTIIWMAAANTSDWTQQTRTISIPAQVSRMNISFAAVKRNVPGNIKISGMQLFASGLQKTQNLIAKVETESIGTSAQTLVAYPNPFEDKIFLKDIDFKSVAAIQLLDFYGKEVSATINWDEMSVDVANTNLPTGIYILTIRNVQGELMRTKMLKK